MKEIYCGYHLIPYNDKGQEVPKDNLLQAGEPRKWLSSRLKASVGTWTTEKMDEKGMEVPNEQEISPPPTFLFHVDSGRQAPTWIR